MDIITAAAVKMRSFIVLSALAAIALAAPAQENTLEFWPTPSERFLGRIINGEVAAANAAPFICSLSWGISSFPHACGGTIISPNWILTAAHCITEMPAAGTYRIQCGVTHRANDVANQQIRIFNQVADVRLHPDWVAGGVGPDDMALIFVSDPLVFNTWVQPIRQRVRDVVDTGLARLFGWGAVSQITPSIPNDLRTAEKDLLSLDECEARLRAVNIEFGDYLRSTNICTARGNTAACGGDSGGPLVVGTPGNWVQVGIVSWGISPCGDIFGVPSVYARASAYVDWISSTTGIPVEELTA